MELEKVENSDVILLVDSISTYSDLAELPLHPRHFDGYLKKLHVILTLSVMGYEVKVLPRNIEENDKEYPRYYIGAEYKDNKDYLITKYRFPRFGTSRLYNIYLEDVAKLIENFDILNDSLNLNRMEILAACLSILDQYATAMELNASGSEYNKELPQTVSGLLNCFGIIGLMFNLRNLSVQLKNTGCHINPEIEDMLSYIISISFTEFAREFDGLLDKENKLNKNLDILLKKVSDIFLDIFGLKQLVNKDMILSPAMLGALWMYMAFPEPDILRIDSIGEELRILETPLNLDIFGRILQYTNALNEAVEIDYERNNINKAVLAAMGEVIAHYINLHKVDFNPTIGILINHINAGKCYVIFHREEEAKLFANALIDLEKDKVAKCLEEEYANYTFKVFTIFDLIVVELDHSIYNMVLGLEKGRLPDIPDEPAEEIEDAEVVNPKE